MKPKDAVTRLKQIISQGTHKQLAEQLTKEGYRTPRGLKWNANHIASWAHRYYKNVSASSKPAKGKKVISQRPRGVVTVSAKHLSANKKLTLIKQIVLGLHQ